MSTKQAAPDLNVINSTLPPLFKKQRTAKPRKSDIESMQLFWNGPMEAFYSDEVVSLVTGFARKTLQCNRWRKCGIPFRKISGRVLYRKADVVGWLESHKLVGSTSEYEQEIDNVS